jgi:UDPglucose 6-dehydrogenase
MYKIGVIGTGYVGLVSGTTFATTGNNVICIDIDQAKVEKMRNGICPIFEPGLDHLMGKNIKEERLVFSTELKDAVLNCQIIFLCLPTPPNEDGSADLQHVMRVATDIANIIKSENIKDKKIVVNKSTVPVGTGAKVKSIFTEILGEDNIVNVASNPEFLREGFAVEDALKPDRVVIGTDSEYVKEIMNDLYAPFVRSGNPVYIMDIKSAEVTKYAANSFLATKISFMNDLSAYCEAVGADIEKIRIGIGSDTRIGKRFLFAGVGYGGSCFPKDVQALLFSAEQYGTPLSVVKAAEEVNYKQTIRFVDRVSNYFNNDLKGKKIAIWGLAFKPNTDDTRQAPAFIIIEKLLQAGAEIHAYDEEAIENTKLKFGNSINYCDNMYQAADQAEALLIVTEWNVFRNPDFDKLSTIMKNKLIFDGRNLFEFAETDKHGFEYYCIGRTK